MPEPGEIGTAGGPHSAPPDAARTDPDHAPPWPALPLAPWQPTRATLHLWTQIVGKVRLTLTPPVNHGWHVALYVSPRGLTTSLIPHGGCALELEFDFHAHVLLIRCARGQGEDG